MSIRLLASASLFAAALTGLGTACRDGPAGPDEDVLIGQFGASDLTMELLATHVGVEITFGCGDYFASDEAALLDDEATFAVEGRFHYRHTGDSDAGTLSGFVTSGVGQSVTFTFGEGGTAADPIVVTLRRGERYTGLPLPCPA
jgi:hypothetical protein